LKKERFYCVHADYAIRSEKTFWGYDVDVKNHAEDKQGNVYGGPLCAVGQSDDPAKLKVAPCFLPQALAGPYWVLAYDEDEGYALVSGGQPTIDTGNGCKTGDGTNDSGLWIFLRSRDRDDDLIEKVRRIAKEQGFDLTVLLDVDQKNCADYVL